MATTRARGHTRRWLATIVLTGALVTMTGGVAAQTGAASKETVTGPSHLDEAEMWGAVEQSVESMCMCLGRRAMQEEMTFEEMSRSPEKLQTWSMEAFSGGRCRPTGILARMLGLQQESSGDKSTKQSSPQSKSLWSEIELAEMMTGCVQSIMLPAKRDYTIRAQVSEGLNLARVAQAAVRERFHATGELAANNETAGLELANRLSGKYVSSVEVDAGSVVITYGNDAHVLIDGQTIVLTPEIQPNNLLNWTCSSHSIEPKHLPAACR